MTETSKSNPLPQEILDSMDGMRPDADVGLYCPNTTLLHNWVPDGKDITRGSITLKPEQCTHCHHKRLLPV